MGSFTVNAVADMLCTEVLSSGEKDKFPCNPPPMRNCRHRTIEFGAVHSDGKWARETWQKHLVESYMLPGSTGSMRAGGHCDLLRAAGVRPYDKRMVLNGRTGRISLLNRRVDHAASRPGSFARYVCDLGCPCGKGPQTLRHVCCECELPKLVDLRMDLLDRGLKC